MTFDARAATEKLRSTLDDFEFTGLDGETYTLPNLKGVEAGALERFREGSLQVLGEIADEDTYQAFLAMPNGVAEQLVTAWTEHSGMAGKAPSPPPRTRKSGTRSKRT